MMSFKDAISRNRVSIGFFLGIGLFGLLIFRVILDPSSILFTTDDSIGSIAVTKQAMPHSFLGFWDDSILAGMAGSMRVGLTTLLIWLLPVKIFINWIHFVHLVLASIFLTLYLRLRNVSWPACAIGLLAAFWLGSNFTLTYAGHTWKFGVLMFTAAFLFFVEKAARTRRCEWAVLAGAALGGLFLEQPDLALFFAIFLAPYTVFAIVRENGFNVRVLAKLLSPAIVAGALLAFHPMWTSYLLSQRSAGPSDQEDPRQKWEFVTQWSWPPEESIDFIAPGFTGWRSGEPQGPYVGRMGRSAGWEQAPHQGFQNFKLENQYLGAIPVVFAVWAVFLAWHLRRARSRWNAEVAFWAAVAAISLLLSFGKYFPLYRLFYLLPAVSSIRNPNKFLQIFQIAVAILAALGFDAALSHSAGATYKTDSRAIRRFVIACFSLAGILGFFTLTSVASWGSQAARFSEWGAAADVIVGTRCWALGQGAFMVLAAAIALKWMLRPAKTGESTRSPMIAWIAVALLAVDAFLLSGHYVMAMPKGLIDENDVVKFLKYNLHSQRTAMVSQGGFYNAWLTYLFPYYGLRSVNVTQMPRMPEDYQAFLSTAQRQPLRFWQRLAVGYVLGPAQIWGQIQNDPSMKDALELVYAFNMSQDPSGATIFSPATQVQPGQHVVLHVKAAAPRYALIGSWASMPDSQALDRISSSDTNLFAQALLSDQTGLPGVPSGEPGPAGEVAVKEYRSGRVMLQASADRPAILRVSEKYDPNWKATVDGKPVPLYRCDYLFQGVYVEPGLHEVVLAYTDSTLPFWVELGGLVLCVLAAANLIRKRGPTPAT